MASDTGFGEVTALNSSLRARLARAFLAVAAGVVLLTAALTFFAVTNRFETYVRSTYELRHRRLVQAIEEAYAVSGGDWGTVRESVGYLGLLGGFDFVVKDPGGKTVIISSSAGMHRRGPMGPPGSGGMMRGEAPGMMNRPGPFSEGAALDSGASRSEYPLAVQGKRVGTVSIANPPAFGVLNILERAFRRSLAMSAFAAALLAGLLGWAVALALSRRLTGPILRLKEAADRFAAGDFQVKVPVETHDEVGELSVAFNAMSAQLQRLEEMRRKLTADIGHEVRTPLMSARSLVEAMRDGVLPADSENFLQVERELSRLGDIVADLRALSVAESGQLQLKRESLDLRDVIDEVAHRWTDRVKQKGLSLEVVTGDRPALVTGDAEALERVFMNLVANAFKYTDSGGQVHLALEVLENRVVARVADTGRGIGEEELPFVFERFYRGIDARSSGVEGTGVGLSIVRELVRAQGGEVRLESRRGSGTTAIIVLPLAKSQQA